MSGILKYHIEHRGTRRFELRERRLEFLEVLEHGTALGTKRKFLNGHVRCLVRQHADKQQGTLLLRVVNRA